MTLNGALKLDDAFKSEDEVDDTFWPCCSHDDASVRPQLLDACGTGGSSSHREHPGLVETHFVIVSEPGYPLLLITHHRNPLTTTPTKTLPNIWISIHASCFPRLMDRATRGHANPMAEGLWYQKAEFFRISHLTGLKMPHQPSRLLHGHAPIWACIDRLHISGLAHVVLGRDLERSGPRMAARFSPQGVKRAYQKGQTSRSSGHEVIGDQCCSEAA